MAGSEKLTKMKRELLALMAESPNGITVYQAVVAGSGGLGLSNLVKSGLATTTRYVGGQLWSITDAGRAALSRNGEKP